MNRLKQDAKTNFPTISFMCVTMHMKGDCHMKNNSFYDLTSVSFSDRETFNNAILLLSMVKSEAYYIIGFSRLKKKIEIGFDFRSSYNSVITQNFMMKLSDPKHVYFEALLKGLGKNPYKKTLETFNGNFCLSDGNVIYRKSIERDEIVPISIEKVDEIIKDVKQEIIDFIEACFDTVS